MTRKSDPPAIIKLDATEKRKLMSHIGALPEGLYEISIRAVKPRRSVDQNSYYWSGFIVPWLEWLREASGEPWITKEQAHEALKRHVLGTTPIINKGTGEVIDEMIPDSRFMDTKEFSEYLDRAAEFLASFAGVVVIPAELFYEGATKGTK